MEGWCEVLLNCVKDGWIYLPWQLAWQSQEYQGALGSGRPFQDHLYTPSLAWPCVWHHVTLPVIMYPLHSLRKVPRSLLLHK